jgi:hypothetical protein
MFIETGYEHRPALQRSAISGNCLQFPFAPLEQEEDLVEVVRSINISSLQDENPVTKILLKKRS